MDDYQREKKLFYCKVVASFIGGASYIGLIIEAMLYMFSIAPMVKSGESAELQFIILFGVALIGVPLVSVGIGMLCYKFLKTIFVG